MPETSNNMPRINNSMPDMDLEAQAPAAQPARATLIRVPRAAAAVALPPSTGQVMLSLLTVFFVLSVVPAVYLFWLILVPLLIVCVCARRMQPPQTDTLAERSVGQYGIVPQVVPMPGLRILPGGGRVMLLTHPHPQQAIDALDMEISALERELTHEEYDMLVLGLAQRARQDAQRAPPGPPIDSLLSRLPIHAYQERVATSGAGAGTSSCEPVTCPVCLDHLAEGQSVLTVPCLHQFHEACITPWIRQQGHHATCPMCKTPVFSSTMMA